MKVNKESYNATRQQLINVPLPIETKSYKPISHEQLINLTMEGIYGAGLEVEKEVYSWAKDGNVAVGRYHIKGIEDSEMQLQAVWQNSYNKSLPLKFSLSCRVLVCSNGMIAARDVNYFKKKHQGEIQILTPNIIPEYISRGGDMFRALQEDRERMKQIEVNKRLTSELLGRLFIEEGLLESTQLNIVKRELENPTHNYGDPNSLWSLYQYVTFAIGGIHPSHWLQDHLDAHTFFVGVAETFTDDKYEQTFEDTHIILPSTEDKRQLKLFPEIYENIY